MLYKTEIQTLKRGANLLITIVGCGALGSLFAARMLESGVDVQALQRPGAHYEVLKEKGLTLLELEGEEKSFSFPVYDDIDSCAPSDLVIILVKAFQTPHVAPKLLPLLKEDGAILTLQNGLGNVEVLKEHVPLKKLFAGSVTYGAYRVAPGVVKAAGEGKIKFGPLDKMVSPEPVMNLLKKSGFNVELVNDPMKVLWEKVAINAMINPVVALARCNNGKIREVKETLKLCRVLFDEALEAARCEGITLDEESLWSFVMEVLEKTAANRPSMLQDLESGRRTENEAISGYILKAAEKKGVELPATKVVYSLMKLAEHAAIKDYVV